MTDATLIAQTRKYANDLLEQLSLLEHLARTSDDRAKTKAADAAHTAADCAADHLMSLHRRYEERGAREAEIQRNATMAGGR